jgi:hypothetical protein
VFLETPGVHSIVLNCRGEGETEKPSVSKTPGFWYSTQVYRDGIKLAGEGQTLGVFGNTGCLVNWNLSLIQNSNFTNT